MLGCRSRHFLLAPLLVAACGCGGVAAGRKAVDRVDVFSGGAVPAGEVKERIGTGPSPRFLGLWDGVVYDYQYYDKFVLQRDLARIERLYRAKGYYDAKVAAGRVIPTKDGHVRVEIAIDEGEAYRVQALELTGLDQVPFRWQRAVLDAMNAGLKDGECFEEERYEGTKRAMRDALSNEGFAWAQVTGDGEVNLLTRRVAVTYKVDAGVRFKIGRVRIHGLEPGITENHVRRVLGFKEGDDFSEAQIRQAKQNLIDLGVFASADVTWTQPPRRKDPEEVLEIPRNEAKEPAVEVEVKTTRALLQTVRLGFGAELDAIRADVHGVAGWEDRNFLGGLRRFTLTLKPGVVLFPTKLSNLAPPERYLPEGKLHAEFRQPGLFDPRAALLLNGDAAMFPVLQQEGQSTGVILGYRELQGALGLDRPFWGDHVYVRSMLHGQWYFPFTYRGMLNAELQDLQIRYWEFETQLSFRDDPVQPKKGAVFSNNLQFAGGFLGGSASDVKVQPDVRFYVPISRTVTFAVRGSVGFLFPRGYDSKTPTPFDQQLMYFRAFYSGGPSSNRGYAYRGVGPHGAGTFLAPNLTSAQWQAVCATNSPDAETHCRIPLGGLSLWESSAEVRFQVLGNFGAVVFADASDVQTDRTLALDSPHLSTGFGVRYKTPVGPIRADLGYRVRGMQTAGGTPDASEGVPGTIYGAPLAFSIAMGEAF